MSDNYLLLVTFQITYKTLANFMEYNVFLYMFLYMYRCSYLFNFPLWTPHKVSFK